MVVLEKGLRVCPTDPGDRRRLRAAAVLPPSHGCHVDGDRAATRAEFESV